MTKRRRNNSSINAYCPEGHEVYRTPNDTYVCDECELEYEPMELHIHLWSLSIDPRFVVCGCGEIRRVEPV